MHLFCTALQVRTTMPSFFQLFYFLFFYMSDEWSNRGRTLCSQGKHFTDWAISQAHKKKMYLFAKDYFLNLCVNMHMCLLVYPHAFECPWRLEEDIGFPQLQEVVSYPMWVLGTKFRYSETTVSTLNGCTISPHKYTPF